MKNVIKRISVILCLAVCMVFAFTLVGCSDNDYTDEDDYANFVKWQARYETEKELVELLRKYDAAYKQNIAYDEYSDKFGDKPLPSLSFVLEGRTVLTDENITRVENAYDSVDGGYIVTVAFDSVGAAILADITANNIGKSLDIIQTLDNESAVIMSPTIKGIITDGRVPISGNLTADSAEALTMAFLAKNSERLVSLAAAAYNDKLTEYHKLYTAQDYLPPTLTTQPPFFDVSTYLQKAEALGL